jgi:hypothetical protein
MAEIEVKVFRNGRHIKTIARPQRVVGGVKAVVYKNRVYPLSASGRIDIDKPSLAYDGVEEQQMPIVQPTARPTSSTPESGKVTWDPEQSAVIAMPAERRILVSAGPGMGKTAVACARVAKLISDGVEPANIWLISFTRTAVREIRNRIAQLTAREDRASSVKITTLDSHAWHLAQGFDSTAALKAFKGYDETIESVIALLKNGSDELDEYLEGIEHLIVDEAQDLVGSRAELVFQLIQRLPVTCGVTVFTDEAQAIYGWSGDNTNNGASEPPAASLVHRLAWAKFEKTQLRTIHRTSSASLKSIFESTRAKVLRQRPDVLEKVLEVRTDIESFADGTVEEVMRQQLGDHDDVLLLFRRRGEVLMASSFLLDGGIRHRIRMSGTPVCIAPWVAIILRDYTERTITKAQFYERWQSRIDAESQIHPTANYAWTQLMGMAGDHGGRVEIRRLRAKLGVSNPPLAVCTPELGSAGSIVGTIHASKGREADRVHLMLPHVSDDDNKRALDEEGRVLFVGATRARHSLYVGKGYAYAGASLDSGRAIKFGAKGKGTWARVEMGRAGDIQETMCVKTTEGRTAASIDATQDLLSKYGTAITRVRGECIRLADGTYEWRLIAEADGKDRYVATLSEWAVADLFEVGRKLKSWHNWSARLKPTAPIRDVFMIGTRSFVLPPGSPHADLLQAPYSESGIFLCPIVYGFAYVKYTSY